jgi:hypothetical protein
VAENMPKQPKSKSTIPVKKETTQAHLPIADIRNGILVLKDGSLRLVMIVSTVNFDLKSEAEQNALIYAYQNFINSLEFPIQIVMQSRKLDLGGYLVQLEGRLAQTQNELLKMQIEYYIDFINKLLKVANIMNKRFFIVIPYFPPVIKKMDFWSKFKTALTTKETLVDMTHFEEYRKELVQRAQVIASGLGVLGLRAVQLSTQELIELLYQTYNPELAIREKLVPAQQLAVPVVQEAPPGAPTPKPPTGQQSPPPK